MITPNCLKNIYFYIFICFSDQQISIVFYIYFFCYREINENTKLSKRMFDLLIFNYSELSFKPDQGSGLGHSLSLFFPSSSSSSSSSSSMNVTHYIPLLALTVSFQSSPKYYEEIQVGTIPIKLVLSGY
jgi:hypothetical protein